MTNKPDPHAEFLRGALDKNIATTVYLLARNHGKREAFKTLSACVAALNDDLSLTYENPTEEKE